MMDIWCQMYVTELLMYISKRYNICMYLFVLTLTVFSTTVRTDIPNILQNRGVMFYVRTSSPRNNIIIILWIILLIHLFSNYIVSYHHQVNGGVRVSAVIFHQFIRPWISQIGRWSGVVGEQQVGFQVVRTTVRDKREPRLSTELEVWAGGLLLVLRGRSSAFATNQLAFSRPNGGGRVLWPP